MYFELLVEVFTAMHGFNSSLGAGQFSEGRCASNAMRYLRAFKKLHDMFRVGLTDRIQIAHQPWHMRPKMHMLEHLALGTVPTHGDPSGFWCYADESYVGRVKKIARCTAHPKKTGVEERSARGRRPSLSFLLICDKPDVICRL